MNALKETIFAALESAGGTLPFARFMELALYAPELGYYERPQSSPGRRGDYYTSVSVGPVFGQLLAARFARWLAGLENHPAPLVLAEAGAHDGRLAMDILQALQARAETAPFEYWIIDPSPARRAWQAERLRAFQPLVRWADHPANLPAPCHGVIFSNELLDALPVHRLIWDGARQHWQELGFERVGDGFGWRRMEPTPGLALPAVPPDLRPVLPDGFLHDFCPVAAGWWSAAARRLNRGWLLTLDYGREEADFFTPACAGGTLRGYREHRPVGALLADPGEQDLTADVNFTALLKAGEAAGLATGGLYSQADFLVGIAREMETDPGWEWTPARTRQFQTLIHPAHLGRRFRALVQQRT